LNQLNDNETVNTADWFDDALANRGH